MAIQHLKYKDFDAIKLTFNPYSVTILNERGCNIIDFADTERNLSFLHFPEADEEEEFLRSVQRFGSAILFPPNKLFDGAFTVNNVHYDLKEHNIHIAHGLLKEFPFQIEEIAENEDFINIKFTFNSVDCVYYHAFGWLFQCTFDYTLSSQGLMQHFTFTNLGETNIPLGIGFHTAFRIPQDDNSSKEDYRILVSSKERWALDSSSFPTGELLPLSQDYNAGAALPLARPIAEHIKAAALKNGFHGAMIINQKNGTRFIYETDPKFKHWMIWNNNASDNYVCIEPMSCVINAPNVSRPELVAEFLSLNPKESWEITNRMYVKF